VLQNSQLAVIKMMNNINTDKVKVLAVTIKSYVYNILNVCYRHRRYEDPTEHMATRFKEPDQVNEVFLSEDLEKRTKAVYNKDIRFYLKYHFKYNYYKAGLIVCGAKKKMRIKEYVIKADKKLKDKFFPK
jgi:hypothetical protein